MSKDPSSTKLINPSTVRMEMKVVSSSICMLIDYPNPKVSNI